jgi:RNA polymerase sigma-70 factor (ECF subfamily)
MEETSSGNPHSAAERGGDLTFNTSVQLLRRAQAGDADALNQLLQRYLPTLRRWATGRLPGWARDRSDTDDLLQEMVIAVLRHVDDFQPRGDGALRAYMRKAFRNRIRHEIRRVKRRPLHVDVELENDETQCPDPAASPLEETIGKELVERYETALARLRPEDREAIIARLEMGCSFEQIAEVLDKPSANAARMAVSRAIDRLGREMNRDL